MPPLPLGLFPGFAAEPSLREQFSGATWWWQDMVLVLFASTGGMLLTLDLLKIWGGVPTSALNVAGNLLQEVFLILVVVMWIRYIRPGSLRMFGRSEKVLKDIGLGLGLGLVGLIANNQVTRATREIGRVILGHYPVSKSVIDQHGTVATIAIGLALIVGAPIAEELFFRGFVYGGLRRRLNVPAAVIISATVFASVHFYLVRMPSVFVLGVIFALVYEKRRNLLPTMIAHSVNNAIVFVLALTVLRGQ